MYENKARNLRKKIRQMAETEMWHLCACFSRKYRHSFVIKTDHIETDCEVYTLNGLNLNRRSILLI